MLRSFISLCLLIAIVLAGLASIVACGPESDEVVVYVSLDQPF